MNSDDFLKMQGVGVLIYANGDVYDGQFHNNVPHGRGKYTYADDGETCEGMFQNGDFVDDE
jgi:hypothetical protein